MSPPDVRRRSPGRPSAPARHHDPVIGTAGGPLHRPDGHRADGGGGVRRARPRRRWSAARPASASPRWWPPSAPAPSPRSSRAPACSSRASRCPLAALEQIFDARGGWPGGRRRPSSSPPSSGSRPSGCGPTRWRPAGPRRPTTLVIEDLQWADETTCDFLVYLAVTARPAPAQPGPHPAGRRDAAARAGSSRRSSELTRLPGAPCVELRPAGPGGDARAGRGPDRQRRRRRRDLVRAVAGQPLSAGRAGEGPRLAPGQGRAALPGAQPWARTPPSWSGWPRSSGSGCPTQQLCRASELRARPVRRRRPARRCDAGVLVVDGADYAFRHSLMCEAVLVAAAAVRTPDLHERAARRSARGRGRRRRHRRRR